MLSTYSFWELDGVRFYCPHLTEAQEGKALAQGHIA